MYGFNLKARLGQVGNAGIALFCPTKSILNAGGALERMQKEVKKGDLKLQPLTSQFLATNWHDIPCYRRPRALVDHRRCCLFWSKGLDVEKVLEVISNFANSLEATSVKVKQDIAELVSVESSKREAVGVAVREETFTVLRFEPQKGEHLGDFEVAYKAGNLPDKWVHAFNVLRQNNSVISSRYHGEGYVYSYWLYGEWKIYRQRLKA
jgi:hypothetical protein